MHYHRKEEMKIEKNIFWSFFLSFLELKEEHQREQDWRDFQSYARCQRLLRHKRTTTGEEKKVWKAISTKLNVIKVIPRALQVRRRAKKSKNISFFVHKMQNKWRILHKIHRKIISTFCAVQNAFTNLTYSGN